MGDDSKFYDVCVVGAGISGLNALVVATDYLPRSAQAVLVDARSHVGGMWVDTYDYVRLHQPHPIFTAGNIKWRLNAERSHLASKGEVLDHLQHCLEVARRKIELDERFGWSYIDHEERDGLVEVHLREPDGTLHTLIAKRLIKAFGHQVVHSKPLTTSSPLVRSTTPETLDLGDLRADDAPVWIVRTAITTGPTAATSTGPT